MSPQERDSAVSTEAESAEHRALAVRIGEGDAAAETELVCLFTPRIIMMGMIRIGDREAVRDVAQEVLMAVISALRKQQLHDPEKLAAFVAGTARNLINSYLRKKALRPPEVALPLDLRQAVVDSEAREAEQERILKLALSALYDDDRQLITMILTEGLKPRQIAVRLGVTAEVVRTRKKRAIHRLVDLVREMSRS
jgi:RNA polymerase sigma factor (sigma-70 family)